MKTSAFRHFAALVVGALTLACGGIAMGQDLSNGPVGRIEFLSSSPEHHWAIIRGRLGPPQKVWGDLLLPDRKFEGKLPVVVMSHGSEGLDNSYSGNIYRDVWAPPLNAAGYAVFIVDSFGPRGSGRVTGPEKQLTWSSVANLSDALHAFKLLTTHPRIDKDRIYHMGWSRGGQVVLWAAWPTFQQHILTPGMKWAGSIAIYPGCNMRYRADNHDRLPSPLLFLLGDKDDMTPAQPCVEYAEELARKGNSVSFEIYPGTYHAFDRENQPYRQVEEGNFNRCSIDTWMPGGPTDPTFGPAVDRVTGTTLKTPAEWGSYFEKCKQTSWITVQTNATSRAQAIKDVLDFLAASSR